MNSSIQHYFNGEGIHIRDRVRYKGVSGTIVFVTDGETGEFAPGYEDYSGHEAGLMFCDDDGDLTFLHDADEELELVRHHVSGQD
jgi:hypothetical protein